MSGKLPVVGSVLVAGNIYRSRRCVVEEVKDGWVKLAELKWRDTPGEMERNGVTARLKLRDFGSVGMVPFSKRLGGAFDRVDENVRVVD